MGIREDLFKSLVTRGFDTLQEQLNIEELQKKHNAYRKQVLMVRVADIKLPAIYLQVRDGKVNRTFEYDGKPDAWIAFRSLEGLLNFLDGTLTIDDVFAYDGMVEEDGKLVKEIKYEGDWYRGSIVLKEVLGSYIDIIRNVLQHEMKLAGIAVRSYAKLKKAFAPATEEWDNF